MVPTPFANLRALTPETYHWFALWFFGENHVNRIFRPLVFILATVYFVVDAVFLTVAKPIADWLADRRIFDSSRDWIVSLRPYPTLALFAVPLIVLEPIKPVAAYLGATGHVMTGVAIFVVGEILKLVLVERLFTVSRDKLMSIAAFAWAYGQYRQIGDRLESTESWQAMRRWSKIVLYTVRIYLLQLKSFQRAARISFQSR
jgi:hypothetical protein